MPTLNKFEWSVTTKYKVFIFATLKHSLKQIFVYVYEFRNRAYRQNMHTSLLLENI